MTSPNLGDDSELPELVFHGDGLGATQDYTEEDVKNYYRQPMQDALEQLRNKAMERMILQPLSYLLSWLAGGSPSDWDTVEEIRNDLLPAIIRRVLGPLGNLLGTGDDDDIDSDTKTSLLANIPGASAIYNVVTGVATGLTGILATAAGLVGLRWDQVDQHDTDIGTAMDLSNTAFANAASVEVHAASLQSQVSSLNSLLFSRNSRPLSSGLVANGESSIEYDSLGDSPVNVTATPTSLPWGLMRAEVDQVKNLVAFPIVSSVSASLTAVYADIYVFNEDHTKSYFQSVDFLGQLTGGAQWVSFDTADLEVGAPADIGVQIRCVGSSGNVVLKARDFAAPGSLPGEEPGNVGMVRTTNNAPTTIAAGDGAYNAQAVYFEYGNGESGATAAPPLDFYDGFSGSILSTWLGSGTKNTGEESEDNSGRYIDVSGGRLVCTRDALGSRYHYRIYNNRTRRNSLEASITVVSPNSLWSGLIFNTEYRTNITNAPNGPYEPFLLVMIKEDNLLIATCADWEGTSFTNRANVGLSSAEATGRWIVDVDADAKTYRVYRDGDVSPRLTWVDTGGVLPTDRRYVGAFFQSAAFSQGSPLDDFRLRDTYTI